MCCTADPCPPIKVICGFECNCNVKNKSAEEPAESQARCAAARAERMLLTAQGGVQTTASASESGLRRGSLIVAELAENKLKL